ISLGIPDQTVKQEISRKTILLRDAVYRYLSTKDLAYLDKKHLAHTLKKDLQATMNQYLDKGRVQNVFIEEYVIY
ncbi:MAG: flagellar basal body-associated FliL family protein, partial [Desulfovibrionales bacterium]